MSDTVKELDAQLRNAIAAVTIERERAAARETKLNHRIHVLTDDLEAARRVNTALEERIRALRDNERETVKLKNQYRDLQHQLYTERHTRAEEQLAFAQEKTQLAHLVKIKHEQINDYQRAEDEARVQANA